MEHKTKAVEVSFLKKTKWTGTTTRTLTFPVNELADRCLNAWLDITDESLSHSTLPSTQLAERFSTLMESGADQAAWDEFHKAVNEEFSRLSTDELAAYFIDLNDPSTIESVLWSDGEHEFLNSGRKNRY